MNWLCTIGIHRWLELRFKSLASIRCTVRSEVRGKRCGRVTGLGDCVVDRVCKVCGKRDDRISKAMDRIRKEEEFIYERLKATGEIL